MANRWKFQFMISSEITVNHLIDILIKKIASSKSLKLLRLTTDNKLNVAIHIRNLCKMASAKLKGLGRIRDRLSIPHALYNSTSTL